VASKTGSTNSLRDAWLMGYAPNITVGTWVGNNDNTPMGGGLSGLIVTPMWREFMDIALAKLPEENFTQPTINLVGVKPVLRGEYIDTSSLLTALQETGTIDPEAVSAAYQNIHSILHYVDKNNPTGPYPNNPNSDQQYANWEYAVQTWRNATYGNSTPETDSNNNEDRDERN
jgi:membrane carboxypeptidase/penicillin-binding protein